MEERNIAFIDIGTNSVRLLLTRANKSYSILSEQKEVVRLGEDEFTDGYLRPAAMQRAILICKEFAEMARANRVHEIVAVATSATREARNKKAFLKRLKEEANLEVHPIAGLEEARLIYLGIVNGIHLADKRALFVDIGGGSTEVIIGSQHEYLHLDSLKLGAIRLATLFFGDGAQGPVSASKYSQLQEHVRNYVVRAMERIQQHPFDVAYGSSGTIENLGDIAIQMFAGRARQREDLLHLDQLDAVIDHLRSLDVAQRAEVPGINPRRADIIIPGAAILHTLMQELGVETLHITNRAMREGMLIDYLMRHDMGGFVHGHSVRMRSVMQLAHLAQIDEPHAHKVAQLSLQLFDSAGQLGLHKLGARQRELLHYAAILHDIGIFLSYNNHQAHSHYLIKNAELLGFDQTEIDIIAATAHFHRKYFPDKKNPMLADLDKKARKAVKVMAILLRIAESLDRGHKGIVQRAEFSAGLGQKVFLDIESDQNWDLEQWGLENHHEAFQRALKSDFEARSVSALEAPEGEVGLPPTSREGR